MVSILGWELRSPITRQKAVPSGLNSILANRGGWLPIIRESFAGAFQHNVTLNRNTVLTHPAVFACETLIASDIAKCRLRLVERDRDGIWSETDNPAYSPVIRKPNSYQTRIQFWEHWMLSKLSNGNVYVLKGRDARGVVTSLRVLDPARVQPLVTEDGEVYYQLSSDNISGLRAQVTVPATEIIHDRMNTLFHPLVGLSPIMAAALAATQGLNIQRDATQFFGNRSIPGGILTTPGEISPKSAAEMKEEWDTNFGGENAGKVAVLGGGLKFEAMRVTAHDAQVVEQLRWTAEVVCSVFHVPLYKIGIGPMPAYNNIQALNTEYYSQALQMLIESAELVMDEGLKTGEHLGVEFDVSDLLRMDSVTQLDVLEKAKSVMTLDERRKRIQLKPIKGGNTVYLQQQDHSIEAIAARDSLLIEQAEAGLQPAPAPIALQPTNPPAPAEEPEDDDNDEARAYEAALCRLLEAA